MSPKVFFVTGTSSGFGAELVKTILEHGDIAVATARNPSQLSFEGATSDNFLALKLDVTDKQAINDAFDATIKKFGRVDVVINNAGYGLAGVAESLSDKEMRFQMDVNFFSVVDITIKAISVMRELKTGGVIQQITSIGGCTGYPGFTLYSASKFAVEGFTEGIAKEVNPEWNIRFQLVEPGQFRTDWGGRSLAITDGHPAYDTHFNVKDYVKSFDGLQPGNPPKAAQAMYKLALMEDAPLRCVLGSDAYKLALEHIEQQKSDVIKYKDLAFSTDFTD